ncbi:MAG: arylesterase [Ectothiorhodospiraceae bacterium]|nr:arylesterase [Ectothiorhodospiraceae bacterium]MCH8503441.1 GDSL-type esterase/lipase family protein [Ectothiorhodospiraceae bacterium]
MKGIFPGRRLACWLLVAALLLAGCGRDQPVMFAPLPSDAVVIVIGDSLVYGTGAPRDSAWPEVLAGRTGWSVVNAGVPGDTSAAARQRLAGLLDAHHPDAVVIAVGGNDFLRDVSLEQTRSNLEAMIRESRAVTSHVALVAIPERSLGRALAGRLADHALFGELARGHELAFVPSAVSEVLSRDELRSDRIHANAEGYTVIADRVAEALAEHGWLSPAHQQAYR